MFQINFDFPVSFHFFVGDSLGKVPAKAHAEEGAIPAVAHLTELLQ